MLRLATVHFNSVTRSFSVIRGGDPLDTSSKMSGIARECGSRMKSDR